MKAALSTGSWQYGSTQISRLSLPFSSAVSGGTMRPMEASTRPRFFSAQAFSSSFKRSLIQPRMSTSASSWFSQRMMSSGLPLSRMRFFTPSAITGAILGSTFTPTAVAMMSQVAISSSACGVEELTARTFFTGASTVSALETMRTV